MRKICRVLLSGLSVLCLAACSHSSQPIQGVIITGQNNHNWPVSSEAIRLTLEQSGLFAMDVAVSPAAGEDMAGFQVDFSRYELVVLDYNGDPWPEPMQRAFEEYVNGGGGLIIYHAADNAFPEWKFYNQVIALGGWGGRNETAGPYRYWQDGALVRDTTAGPGGSHGKRSPYLLNLRRGKEHPIMQGLPERWMHAKDELYDRMRGPGEIGDLLLTGYAEPDRGGSGREEPLVFTVQYGSARIFHTMLGHAGTSLEDNPAMQCTGFQTLLLRAGEWCARGCVTQDVPADFPDAEAVSLRPAYREPEQQ